MERSMTFPGVASDAASGETGQQEEGVLQARDEEVPFEALSMRPTEVRGITLFARVAGRAD